MITKPTIYTKEFVTKELASILADLLSNEDYIFIGELFEKKSYPRQNFSEWAEDFKEVKEISDTIKKIKEILETRAVKGGMQSKLNSTMTIFHLKNNYNWKDKSEVDQNIFMPKPLDDLTDVIRENNSISEDKENEETP